jgi:hypothetical protein
LMICARGGTMSKAASTILRPAAASGRADIEALQC